MSLQMRIIQTLHNWIWTKYSIWFIFCMIELKPESVHFVVDFFIFLNMWSHQKNFKGKKMLIVCCHYCTRLDKKAPKCHWGNTLSCTKILRYCVPFTVGFFSESVTQYELKHNSHRSHFFKQAALHCFSIQFGTVAESSEFIKSLIAWSIEMTTFHS